MFTGLIEEVGQVLAHEDRARAMRLRLGARRVTEDLRPGDSVAVAGVCLTVVDHDPRSFVVDVVAETCRRTTLAGLGAGARVNLERALSAGARLGGHIVQGHVDGVGRLTSRSDGAGGAELEVAVPEPLARYVAEKGSIAVDGVSLTVASAAADRFGVALVPTTLAATTLGALAPGDPVNLEVDVLAKYVERLVGS